jgi:PAS domain S-box-containing protein
MIKPHIRLSHKLILLVVLTTGVVLVALGMLVIHGGAQVVEQLRSEVMLNVSKRTAQMVERKLETDIREFLILADGLRTAGGQVAVREGLVRSWFERVDSAVAISCDSGQLSGSWRSFRGGPKAAEGGEPGVPAEELTDYGPVFVAHGRGPQGQPVLVIVSKPTADNPTRYIGMWNLSDFSELTQQIHIGQSGYVFLVDKHGHLLGYPNTPSGPAAGAAPPSATLGRSLGDLPMVKDVLHPGPRSPIYYQNENGQEVVAGGSQIPGIDWAVIAEQSEKEAMEPLKTLERQVVFWGLTTGLAAILLGLLIVRQITRPVELLVEAANRVGEGDLTHPVGVATSDEIGQLALAFNEMQIRLREMYEKLERMVSERTHELQQTTDFLNSVLDSSTEYSIIATDLHGMVLSYNEGSRRIFGYEPEEIIGAPISILIPREPGEKIRSQEILRQVRHDGIYSGETERIRKGGRRFPVRFVITLRYDDSGKPVGYTTVSRDITERKELEAKIREYTENLEALVDSKTGQLQEANVQLERANRLKAEFLASMSHELRTPLNAILGFSDVLREELSGPLNEQQRQFVSDIRSSGQQLLNLINDILDLSKVDAGRMELSAEEVELSSVFDEVQTIIQGMAVRKTLSLAFREEPPGIRMQADRVKLLQILYNLLSNAVKFTPPGGSIRVEAEWRAKDVCFRVIDTGVGIPQDSHELIFEEFRQVDARLSREYGGTGLGLALTRKLVKLHGGTIIVESEVGKGSVFTFAIPHVLPLDSTAAATGSA